MAGHNPFLSMPTFPTNVGGAVPSGGDDTATAVVGALPGAGVSGMTRSTPATLGGLVLFAAAVIVLIHIAGIRTHFTVSAGK